VFIISFDGGKPAVMRRSPMPALMRTLKEGAGTWSAQTIYPSVTLPAHTSMLTGVGPQKHKILWNNYEPERGLVTVPTIFSLAHKSGLSTAMFVSKEKFKHLNLPGSVDRFEMPSYSAKTVAKMAVKYIVASKPALCFIHFTDSDTAGHAFGWGSVQQVQAFADEDQALKTVEDGLQQAGIAEDSVLILTADHGGHDRVHGSRSPEDMTIPWIAWGKGVKRGFNITAPVNTCDTAATALWLLRVPLPANMDGKPVASAFTPSR
jgi:predicted AlkP superfamily pyrophosphatase or phosphodiesterase